MKGISSIFSSLIVTLITLSLAVPLMLYFTSLHNSATNNLGQSFAKLNNVTATEMSVINMGNTANKVFLYNYGNTPININLVIINKTYYKVSYILPPNKIAPLSNISTKIENITLTNTTVIVEANGNYYTVYS